MNVGYEDYGRRRTKRMDDAKHNASRRKSVKDVVALARTWLAANESDEYQEEVTDLQVIWTIDAVYPGGWSAFREDAKG